MSIAASSRELMAWICELEDVDPFRLADAGELLAHAREKKLISDAEIETVQERLITLVDRGLLGAIDPLAKLDQPVSAADRTGRMRELRTTAEGRHWAEAQEEPASATQGLTAASAEDPRKVAVMHGRDEAARAAVFALLRKIGLDPLEWEELVNLTENTAPYNGEAVAAAFDGAQAVVVILTPDDVGFLHRELCGEREREDDRDPTGQARLNVVLEAGMALQSHPSRTILVEIGHTREISDLAGRNAVRLDGSAAKLNSLANRLEQAGCPVRRSGNDWLDPSAFATLDALTREPPSAAQRVGKGRTLDEQIASERTSAARRQARHVFVELSTIDRTLELALQNGYWWNVRFEGLPATQWEVARDVLADEAPQVYDAVFPSYVESDQLNKAANSHAQGGHDDYDESIGNRLESLRAEIARAKAVLREYAGAT
ncbi:MAG TPA: nucleotide-binding protein [Solirubrobacterales bacterium]|nr:nucleotide-binding protein [Solirubrobacterales bacterium]